MAAIELTLSGGQSFLDAQGQRCGLVLLGAMLLSFGFIRFSTRMIRAEVSWWPGNVTPGGLHIHHLVFGIVAMMVAGFLAFAVQPGSPGLEILAGLFGVGVGLTLDEFALWLYLEDVYWAEEGRRSVDAVVFATVIAGALLLGLTPVSSADGSILVSVATILIFCLICAAKGKVWTTIGGMFIPFVGLVGAIRLAQPGSPWAQRRYPEGGSKLAKAERRQARHDRRWRWLQDLIGGKPSLPSRRDLVGRD